MLAVSILKMLFVCLGGGGVCLFVILKPTRTTFKEFYMQNYSDEDAISMLSLLWWPILEINTEYLVLNEQNLIW